MAKAIRYVLEERIAEVRSRLEIGRVDGAIYEAVSRIRTLEESLEYLRGTENVELYRHFPVAAIATLEAYFRSVVTMIVDAGGEYLTRGLALVGDKLKAAEAISILHKKVVSIGEIVAYSLPFSSLGHLESTLDQLIGQKFKILVRAAIDPFALRNQTPEAALVVPDVSQLWASLQKTFEIRHVLAHESATKFHVQYEQALLSVESVSGIIEAIDSVLWSTAWKDEPLTQYEMNRHAYAEYHVQRSKLCAAIRNKRKELKDARDASEFRSLHAQWKSWIRKWADYSADRFVGGSIRPMIHASVMSGAYESRIKQIEDITGY